MYVMTEDGKLIVNAIGFSVERNIGGRAGKYAVVALHQAGLINAPIISGWPDEESAKQELQRIWQAMKDGQEFYRTEKQI